MAKTWRNPNQPRLGDCMRFLKELKEAHKENNEEKIAERIATIQKECDEELFSEAIRLNDKYIKEKIRRRDQKEKDDAEAVESLRMMNIAEWRPRIESMKKYIRREKKTFNDWAREDPWAQKTVGTRVEGIPTRLLNNSEIDEIWKIASEEVEKETVNESEPETAALKSKKRKRMSKKKRKKKKKSKKKSKQKKKYRTKKL